MKRYWWIGVIVVVAGAGAWWQFAGRTTDTKASAFVRTALVHRGDLVVSITATGHIDPIEQVDVKSKASGEIIELPIQESDYVRKGDLIARLDRTTAQNDYDQTQADFAVAEVTREQRQREMERQQSLFDKGLSPQSDLDNARLAFEQANSQLMRAKAALSTYKERLQDTEIHSPIDGIVLSRPVEIGQIISSGTTTVTGGTLLCTIANMTKVYVVADVDETDIGKVEVGLTATITADSYPDRHLEGTVLRIAPLAKVQQNVTMFEVTTLVDNAAALLKAGMNASVEVVTARTEDALMIPVVAVDKMPNPAAPKVTDTGTSPGSGSPQMAQRPGGAASRDGAHAETASPGMANNGPSHSRGPSPAVQVRRNGTVSWVPIKTGLSNLDDIVVLEGLAEGDTVVYSLTSGAMRDRQAMVDRMRTMNTVPGMKRTN